MKFTILPLSGFIFLIFILSSNPLISQPTFERIYDEIPNQNYGNSVVQNDDGGYTFVGRQEGSPHNKVLIVRTDIYGDTIWVKTYGSSGSCFGLSVNKTWDGAYIVSGVNNPTLTWPNIHLLKIDANGDTLWTKTFNKSEIEWGISAYETSSDSGYIVCGDIQTAVYGGIYLIKTDAWGDTLWTRAIILDSLHKIGPWGFRITGDQGYVICGASAPFSNPDVRGIFIIKTDQYGNVEWKKNYDWNDYSIGCDVTETYDNGYMICGTSQENESQPCKILLIKTDNIGDTVWTKRITDLTSLEVAYSLVETIDHNYILCGSINSSSSFLADLYLLKTDQFGDTIWTRTYGQDNDVGYEVKMTNDNGIVVVGGSGYSYHRSYLVKTDEEGLITGIGKKKIENSEILVFPIPNRGVFRIESDQPLKMIEIYDNNAQCVFIKQIKGHSTLIENINLSEMNPGEYVIRMQTAGSFSVQKIIIQK
ncbi:MAG: T9SS type A sorting domain-containing protein [Bacteroidales bacterium]|nr:T9SS type A sorting domain-containing protein [Bacteroidales bacterium]